MPVFFMCYIAALLELLCNHLEDLKQHKFKENVICLLQKSKVSQHPGKNYQKSPTNKEKLINCIETHLKIIEMTRKVEKLFSTVIFVEGLISTFVLCTTSFLLTIISPTRQTLIFLKVFCFLLMWLIQILLPCYYSQRVTTQSENLSAALFHSDWLAEDIGYRKIMIIFMENTKRPLRILACGFFKVNLETFVRIANTAYSFFAVFKRAEIKMHHKRA